MAVFGSSTRPSTRRSPSAMVALVIVNPETAGCTDAGSIHIAKPAARISAAKPTTSSSERGVAHLDKSDVCVIVRAPVSVRPIPFVGLPQRQSIAPHWGAPALLGADRLASFCGGPGAS